ncbi:hypothetical protein [Lacimonas salitolerans]|uniref:Uncharacterized protein n=1 Tax=Lacimonas salitolerans TaxID=1323750 RepID=A0ABW4EII8_9RHOB
MTSPAVLVWTESLNASDISLRMTAWIDQRSTSLLTARGEAIRQILAAFEAAGIEMPDPTYRLVMCDPPAPAQQTTQHSPQGPAAPANNPDDSLDVQASTEHQLERIVEEERVVTAQDDLLRRDAPRE